MANLYYREELEESAFVPGRTIEVHGDEARHAVRVARLRVGERILIGNGAGAIGDGEVVEAERDRFAVRLSEVRTTVPPAPRLVLVQALAKGDRDERAIEQATEFGVDAIVPWQAERSVSRWSGDRAAKGRARWSRIVREASKQSLRAVLPELGDLHTTADLCALAGRPDRTVAVLHPGGADRLTEWAAGTRSTPTEQVLLVIGPEGGISDGELGDLSRAGAAVLRLGGTVLRTSSAGPAGIAVLNAALGRW